MTYETLLQDLLIDMITFEDFIDQLVLEIRRLPPSSTLEVVGAREAILLFLENQAKDVARRNMKEALDQVDQKIRSFLEIYGSFMSSSNFLLR